MQVVYRGDSAVDKFLECLEKNKNTLTRNLTLWSRCALRMKKCERFKRPSTVTSVDLSWAYGSIPLEDVNDDTLGVFTIVSDFFEEHKNETCLSSLDLRDFEKLLRLSITTDTI